MNLNKVHLIGRITADIDLKSLPSGTKVANFSVATNKTFQDSNGQKQEKTTFHNIICFGKIAEIASQYFVKGQEIYLEGRIETRNWDDKETGKKIYKTEIVMENFQFGAKPKNSAPSEPKAINENSLDSENMEYAEEDINPNDIPF